MSRAKMNTLEYEPGLCNRCGMCVLVCPHAVLSMNKRKVQIEHRDACMECGACAMNCPTKALTVKAGVGCAAAVINSALGRQGSCCCVIETKNESGKDPSKSCC